LGESSGGEESFADEDEDEDEDDDEEEDEDSATEFDDTSAKIARRAEPVTTPNTAAPHKALDPLAALQDSKRKDVDKGLAIRKQQVRPVDLSSKYGL